MPKNIELLELDRVQHFQIEESVRHSRTVLMQVKSRGTLYGPDLKAMKNLEEAVQNLEVFLFAQTKQVDEINGKK